jgi:GNAT superfamily N-acetyltransferase
VAGFRFLHTLAWGHVLYVDDLVTRSDARGRGHGRRLMEWLEAEARAHGCDQLHLDSGHQRHDAHRLYLNSGMHISSHHFSKSLAGS